ncbi:HNH endonuclease [Paenibacillus ferrarius]|uniref:HNH endonuclease n=1 Tax=Paenibacillus ferrarius TaxID=1469647 RepID=UPI00117DE7FE
MDILQTLFSKLLCLLWLTIDNHYRKYAGKQQKIDLHREHVIHNGSNKIDNCIPSCLNCNSSKHDHDFEKWYSQRNVNYTVDRIDKIYKWLKEDWKDCY